MEIIVLSTSMELLKQWVKSALWHIVENYVESVMMREDVIRQEVIMYRILQENMMFLLILLIIWLILFLRSFLTSTVS